MTQDLKKRTIISVLWNALDKVGFQVVAFCVGLVTLRLLTPRDFGLIGALAIFTALANILVESGFTLAMVRRRNNTNAEYFAVFCFNMLLSISFYLLLVFSADSIAAYYNMPELKELAPVLFVSIILNSLGIVQNIVLTIRLEFKKMSIPNLIGAIVSGIVVVVLILQGWGYWALAWQIVLQFGIKSLMLWILSDWKPCEKPDFRIIKELFLFSFSLIASSLMNTFVRYIYNPIIGRNFGEEKLGYYAEAYKFFFLPSSIVSSTLGGVAYPVLSELNREEGRQLLYLRKMVKLMAFAIFPILLGAAACFDHLVLLVLTEKWMPIVPYFRLMAVGGIVIPFHSLYLNVITLKGYPKRSFLLELIKNVLLVSPLFFLHDNIEIMLMLFSLCSVLSFCVDVCFLRRVVKYSVGEQFKDIFPYMFLSIVMACMVYSVNFLHLNIVLTLLLQIFVGVFFYLGFNHLLGSKIQQDMFQLLLKKNIKQ